MFFLNLSRFLFYPQLLPASLPHLHCLSLSAHSAGHRDRGADKRMEFLPSGGNRLRSPKGRALWAQAIHGPSCIRLRASGPTLASPKRQPPPLPSLLILVHGAHGISRGPSVQGAEEVISLLLLVSPGSALTLLANLEPPWPFFSMPGMVPDTWQFVGEHLDGRSG